MDHVFASFTQKEDLRKTIVFFFQKESFTGCMKGVIHSPKMEEGFCIVQTANLSPSSRYRSQSLTREVPTWPEAHMSLLFFSSL